MTTNSLAPVSFQKKQAIYTISDAEYAPLALTLFDSVRSFYQDSDFYLFILGEGPVKIIDGDINVIYIGDIFNARDLQQRLAYYLQVEIATSLRPQCFQYLFSAGYDRVFYIDPDIYVFRRMTEVDELLDNGVNGIVTAHSLHSSNSDVWDVDGDAVFMQCGIFNLGFLALRNTVETARMLSWWGEQLKWKCLVDWSAGYFVDQKWLEFLPVYFNGFHILKLPTYNFAPWNCQFYQLLTDPAGKFYIDSLDNPVAFIHFSGVKRAERHFRHMRNAYLFYMKELNKRRFVRLELINIDIRFKKKALLLDRICTYIYKQYVKTTQDDTSNPLSDEQFYNYLRGTDEETRLPRYIRALFDVMPDIFVGYARAGIPAAYDSLIPVVRSHFSYDGTLALETFIQLRNEIAGLNYAVEREQESENVIPYYPAFMSFGSDTVASHDKLNGKIVVGSDRTEIVTKTVQIGIPYLDELGGVSASFLKQAKNYTEVWVPSPLCKEMFFKKHGLTNVTAIPYSVPKPIFRMRLTGLPNDKFVILLQHDFAQDFAAQNTLVSVRAFERAFDSQANAQLVCVLLNSNDSDECLALRKTLSNKDNVVLVEGEAGSDMYYSFVHRAHVYISLNRLNVFNYALAEAMSMGKCVIAPTRGGNSVFMHDSNGFLVDGGSVVELEKKAADVMVDLYNDLNLLQKRSKQAKSYIHKHMSPNSIGLIMQKRIEDLQRLEDAQQKLGKRPLMEKVKGKVRRVVFKQPTPVMPQCQETLPPVQHVDFGPIISILLKNVKRQAVLE